MTIYNQSGSAQSSYPISIPRVFRAGDIPHFAQVVVNGTAVLTQCDVKNRWPDGSLKFAIVSFVIPTIAATGPLQVAFQDQSSGNNTGFLDANGMLNNAYDFDGVVKLTGTAATQTISARAMLAGSNFTYWLQGPIVTAVIIEDRANRTFDTNVDGGAGNPLHPIFEAWFYPQNHKVEIGYTIENAWISNTTANSTRDQTYSLTLCAGNINCSSGAPTLALSQASFTHIGFTRWHKSYWIGGPPPSVRLDFNSAYTTSTKAVLNWDYSLDVSPALATYQANWNNMPASQKTIPGSDTFVGDINKYINGGGAQTWIGPQTSWDVLYLLTFDDTMRDEMLTNADLMGRWPMHFREADHFGGSGKFFDHVTTGGADTGLDPQGRVISVNARQTITLYNAAGNLSFQDCGGSALDIPSIGPITIEQWALGGDTNRVIEASHEPDIAYFPYLFSGKYYYLEELQFQAAKEYGFFTGCTDRQGSWGLYPTFELRAVGWSLRQMAHAAFLSPDGTPEQAYFSDKLQNNIAFYEGTQGLPQSYPAKSAVYNYGTNYYFSIANNKSPLSVFAVNTTTGYESSDGLSNCGNGAMAVFQEGFLTFGLAMAREAGFKTDTLMQALAHRPFNLLKNSAVNHYLNGNGGGIEAAGYVNCFRDATTSNWISSWNNFNNYYTSLPTWYIAGDIEGDWALSDLGAIATMYGYTVDGYDAVDVYATFQSYLPYATTSFATVTPKFDILPRAPLSIKTPTTVTAVQSTFLSLQLSATGGAQPYSWSLSSGSLPAGLSFDASGLISGVPIASGNFAFTVQVRDARGASDSKLLTISVAASAGPSITTSSLANAVQNSFYRAQLTASGGTLPYSWSLGSGSLPGGVSLAVSGLISGVPAATGTFTFVIVARDASGASDSKSLTLSVASPGVFNLPVGLGWFNLDATIAGAQTEPQNRLSECPTPVPAGDQGCPLGVFAYSGAAYDTSRNRMIFWGGGHNDYLGNEVYEINLKGTPKWTRLTNPSPNPNFGVPCPDGQQALFETLADGHPNARHSYGDLLYYPDADQFVSAGTGALGCGFGVNGYYTWALDMSSVPSGQVSSAPNWHTLNKTANQFDKITTAVYDPVLHTFFVADAAEDGSLSSLYRWNPSNSTYILIASYGISGTMQMTFPTGDDMMIVPGKALITRWPAAGGSVWQIVDISNMTRGGTEIANADAVVVPMDSSCSSLDTNFPLSTTFDPVVGLPVAYPASGNAVYYFNPSASQTVQVGKYGSVGPRKCLKISYGSLEWSVTTPSGNYPPDATPNGYDINVPIAYGRFTYVPDADVFMYLPDASSPAWILRLR